MAFSQAHWTDGRPDRDHRRAAADRDLTSPWNTDDYRAGQPRLDRHRVDAVTMINGQPFPTRGTAFDYMQHTGDLGGVAFPTWSNDGNTIVYSSTPGAAPEQGLHGRVTRTGGSTWGTPTSTRSTTTTGPAARRRRFRGPRRVVARGVLSGVLARRLMLAFTAVPAGQVMYANPQAELYVVPFGSASRRARRRSASTPTIRPPAPASRAPASTTTGPSGRPTVGTANGKTYYWLIFSSNRYNPHADDGHERRNDEHRLGLAALHHGDREKRGRVQHLSGHLPLQPAGQSPEHHASVARLQHPDRHRQAVALAVFAAVVGGRRRVHPRPRRRRPAGSVRARRSISARRSPSVPGRCGR